MDIKIEQLNDIPVIFCIIKRINLIGILDSVFIPHKNWKGITIGELTAVWLLYLISTQDHRISYLADWANARLGILSQLLSKGLSVYDFSDDKLELLLDMFCDPTQWNTVESVLNQETIKVFDLETDVLRVDATVGKSFQKVIEEGLFQYGNSKQFRNDLPQFKTMLCSLDPLGFPLSSLTVSGNTADDTLYIPVIAKAMLDLPHLHSLFVGDCKLGSIATRAFIEKMGHHYLCPLSGVQLRDGVLEEYIYNIYKQGIDLHKIWKDGQIIAKGYSAIEHLWKIDERGELIIWTEQRFIVRSFIFAKTQIEALMKRINKCINELSELNIKKQGKKTFKERAEFEAECKSIIKKHRVEGLVNYEITENVTKKTIREWKNRPAREEIQTTYTVKIGTDKNKIAHQKKLLGWRVYGSNCTDKDFTLEKAVLLYRKEYIIERRFNCLKNKPLNLLPLYLQKHNRIEALINVLLLALRVISLIEYKVADNLEKKGEVLAGLYAGNPKHTTTNPSAVLILRVFLGIYCIATPNSVESKMKYEITDLLPLQKKLLSLLDIPETEYTDFIKIVDYEQDKQILKI